MGAHKCEMICLTGEFCTTSLLIENFEVTE